MDSKPTEIDELSRKVNMLEIEAMALKKEDDKASKDRLATLESELADLHEKLDSLNARWENEKNSVERENSLREELDAIRTQLEIAKREGDLEKAAELQYGKLPELEKQLEQTKKDNENKELSLVHKAVEEDEISRIVSRWTGIPVSKLNESERNKTLHLDEELHKRVIGQDEGVTKVTEAIIRSKAGIKDPGKPIGSFLFMGPTGVGKTELAKSLAECLFDDENNMIRLDMSEYMEGGQLTEAVRRKPYSVVLFDEVEKAHPDVFNTLLQVLDDGRITDSQGRLIDFKNTILIMTSNIGAQYLLDGIDENGNITEEAANAVNEELRASFRPEFLNRLDEIIMFKPLTKDNISNIVRLIIKDLNRRLSDRELEISLTDKATDFIVDQAYDPVYGARPLKRFIQKHIETLVGKAILEGRAKDGDKVVIDVNDGRLVIS